MPNHTLINLLIVDHAEADIEHVVQTLRGDGYQLEVTRTHRLELAREAIDYQPLDLILARVTENIPTIAELRSMITESQQDIPLIAMLDDTHHQPHRLARLLEGGADNYFYLDDADHLMAVVHKELHHAADRKLKRSFDIRFQESETRTYALLENVQQAIAYIHEGVHSYANPAYLRLFRYQDKEDLANIQLVHMVPPGYRDALKSVLRRSIRSGKAIEPVELVGLRSDGQTFPILLECAPLRINDEPCTQIIVADATPEQNPYNQQLEEMLKTDEATALYSRRFFLESLGIEHDGALLYILFPDYSTIRATMGFEAVEQFTREIASLIKELLGPGDMAVHFASEVFVIYLPPKSSNQAKELAAQLANVVAAHNFNLDGKLFTTTCCIGVYLQGDTQESAAQMLAHADRACEIARQRGGSQIEVYKPPKKETTGRSGVSPEDEDAVRTIREALSGGKFLLYYQPIVSFADAQQARYKAYLRLHEEPGDRQRTDKMAKVAVRYGMMATLDKWTIIRAMAALIELHNNGAKSPAVFIRLSRNSLADKDFIAWLQKRFQESHLPCALLVFEIKEDDAGECFEETRNLRAHLREMGCSLALSHFGGKQHSERLLQELIPDYIKLDGSLIERLAKAKDESSRQAMTSLTQRAHELSVQIVAAGVTTAPQMASIWQFGVTLVQGSMVAEDSEHLDFDFSQYAG